MTTLKNKCEKAVAEPKVNGGVGMYGGIPSDAVKAYRKAVEAPEVVLALIEENEKLKKAGTAFIDHLEKFGGTSVCLTKETQALYDALKDVIRRVR